MFISSSHATHICAVFISTSMVLIHATPIPDLFLEEVHTELSSWQAKIQVLLQASSSTEKLPVLLAEASVIKEGILILNVDPLRKRVKLSYTILCQHKFLQGFLGFHIRTVVLGYLLLRSVN